MSDTNLKFANKLELRYVFNDRSYYMDAWILQRCEKEILTLVRALEDMLDVKLRVYNEPHDKMNGFREKLAVAGEDSRAISVIINMFMRILSCPSLSVGGQLLVDRSEEDEAQMQKEIALLRRGLRLKDPGVTPSKRLLELLNRSPRFCKCKSNFFEALKGYPKVVKLTMRELNERFCLIYTGQRRLARNLLRDVIGRYISGNPDAVEVLYEIQRMAVLMRFELEKGNVDGFAHLLTEHWELSKKLDAGCTNTCIDLILSITDTKQLERVIDKLRKRGDILEVFRLTA